VTEVPASTLPPSQRLAALTGVRALAALWVVLFHYQTHLETLLPVTVHLHRLIDAGYLGVDLFFVLSGFILAYNYGSRLGSGFTAGGYVRFLQLRVARVYPVHLFTLNVVLVLYLLATAAELHVRGGPSRYSGISYIWNLTMTHAWWTDLQTWNRPAWSISAEWLAYLLFPFMALAFVRWRSRLVSAAGAIASYALLMLAFQMVFADNPGTMHEPLVRILTEFVAGCCLYKIYIETPRLHAAGSLSLAVAAVIVIAPFLVETSHHRGYVIAPLFGLLVLTLAYDSGPLASLLSTRAAIFWGEASYALYMTHVIAQPFVNRALSTGLAELGMVVRIAVLAAVFAVLGVIAAGTYLLVERPSRAWVRGIGRPQKSPA
jgi:peptidoglycan/LPS O-acetylase OafA/YrhL